MILAHYQRRLLPLRRPRVIFLHDLQGDRWRWQSDPGILLPMTFSLSSSANPLSIGVCGSCYIRRRKSNGHGIAVLNRRLKQSCRRKRHDRVAAVAVAVGVVEGANAVAR